MIPETASIASALLNALFTGLALMLGGAVGWWLRAKFPMREEEAERMKDQARESLSRLQELATSVAADVGEHNSQMLRINQQLEVDGATSEEAVLAGLAQLITANEQLQNQLNNAEQRLELQARELETHALDARTDPLTNLANRRGFDDSLNRRFAEWQRRARPHCLLLLDVDHFKQFNDVHGHQAGDEVLRQVGAALKKAMREMDAVCRYGGEEFAVILPDTVASEGKIAAVRARKAIEAVTIDFDGQKLSVTASEGLAEIMPSDDPASLIRRADEALYASKQAGRNRATFHDGRRCVPISETEQAASPPPETKRTPADEQDGEDGAHGLPSQMQFRAELKRRVAECHRFNATLSILLLEVANYRAIEQQFGPELASQILQTVGGFLDSAFREMDMVAYYGKGTFAAMLPGTAMGGARVIASRTFDAISSCRLPLEDEEITLALNLGLAEYLPTDNAESLLGRADTALHASRQPGAGAALAHNGDGCVPLTQISGGAGG